VQWESLLVRVGPILAFLVCVTIVAELADGLGVFSTLAQGAARLAQGSVLGLWLLIVAVAVAQLCGVGAVGANLVDNLPSYLALEPAADASPLRLATLLVGVNAGPLITPWASHATLLWAARCRSACVAVSWRRFAARGAVLVPLLLAMSVTSLWLAQG
jgi:arsenical pump membrane protein